MEEIKVEQSVNSLLKDNKNNSFLVMLLSILLLISVFIAGFFAWKTQQLVTEMRVLKSKSLSIQTPLPTLAPAPKTEPVSVSNLIPNAIVVSPIKIEGTIDKDWTFESTFSIEILDSNRKSINTIAVTADFNDDQSKSGSFSASIPFKSTLDSGFIVFHADNPSGLAQNDKSYEIPVKFKLDQVACTMDAKICPDGSAVGRSGPKCEFAACPTTSPLP